MGGGGVRVSNAYITYNNHRSVECFKAGLIAKMSYTNSNPKERDILIATKSMQETISKCKKTTDNKEYLQYI